MVTNEIVWEEKTFTKFNIFRVCIALFMLWTGYYLFRLSLYLNLLLFTIFGLFILIVSIVLLLELLFFAKEFFLIRFTKSSLSVKNRNLMLVHRYNLSDIVKIDINFIRKKEWSKIRRGRGSYALLEFKFKVLSSNYKENTYTFKKVSFASTRAFSWEDSKKQAFELRSVFEDKIHTLSKIFPELISISETYIVSRKWSMKTIMQLILMLIMAIFAFSLYYSMRPERAIITFSLIPIALISTWVYAKIKKSKEKKSQ